MDPRQPPRDLPSTRGPVDRSDILEFVRTADTGLTTPEVAAKVGLAVSTARTHLDKLVRAGLLVKARASSGLPFRPAWRYRAAAVDPAPTVYQLLLAAVLEDLAARGEDSRSAAARVGEGWGSLLGAAHTDGGGATAAVLAVLEALGFTPDTPGPSTEVHLRTCPYMQLVKKHPDAMCGLHAGIIRGVLRESGAQDGTAVLEPFAAPGACVVRLSPGRPLRATTPNAG